MGVLRPVTQVFCSEEIVDYQTDDFHFNMVTILRTNLGKKWIYKGAVTDLESLSVSVPL